MEIFPLILISPILLYCAFNDLKNLKIPNFIPGLSLIIFFSMIYIIGLPEFEERVLQGLLVFGICFLLFSLRLLGGGDAKLIPVVFLFIPSSEITTFMLCLSTGMTITLFGLSQARSYMPITVDSWRALRSKRALPMGPAIATATMIFLVLQLNLF